MKMAFAIGIVLVVLAVLTSVAAAVENVSYFGPQHASADTGDYQLMTIYFDISDGTGFSGAQIELKFNKSNADIPDGYCTKGCPPAAAGEHCWEAFDTNYKFTDNGYMWLLITGPQEAVWKPVPPPGHWEYKTIDHFTGPMQVKMGDCYVTANTTGTAGVSPFDFAFEHYPLGCPVCMRTKFSGPGGIELDWSEENGTFTHGGPFISSCNANGMVTSSYDVNNEKDAFVPGEKVYAEGFGLEHSTGYKIWMQDDPVEEGYSLVGGNCTNCIGDCPGKTGLSKTSDAGGHFGPTEIWNIPATAPITCNEYDIAVDKQGDGANTGKYNAASDGIDDATVEGFVAPIPEMATIALVGIGLLCLVGIGIQRRRRGRKI